MNGHAPHFHYLCKTIPDKNMIWKHTFISKHFHKSCLEFRVQQLIFKYFSEFYFKLFWLFLTTRLTRIVLSVFYNNWWPMEERYEEQIKLLSQLSEEFIYFKSLSCLSNSSLLLKKMKTEFSYCTTAKEKLCVHALITLTSSFSLWQFSDY